MATTGNVPPQAYTREILSQAFEWLKSQPLSVRERATTADGLVSMYLQSRRTAPGAPVAGPGQPPPSVDVPSVESFKSDLRNLAENMRTFETAEPQVHIRPPAHHRAPVTETFTATASTPATDAATASTLPRTATVTSGISTPKPIEPKHSYDSQTMESIQTVREKLNLSSDSEALRMLVKLGFEKIRTILS